MSPIIPPERKKLDPIEWGLPSRSISIGSLWWSRNQQ